MASEVRIKKLEERLCKVLSKSEKELNHGLKTRDWLLKLYPDAGWELQISALAHDIERVLKKDQKSLPQESYAEYKKRHAERSATVVKSIMSKLLFHPDEIDCVYNTIAYHDNPNLIGTKDAIAVSDADSVRFFDEGLPKYIKSYGIEGAKAKSTFMYERVSKVAKKAIDALDFNSEIKEHLSKNGH